MWDNLIQILLSTLVIIHYLYHVRGDYLMFKHFLQRPVTTFVLRTIFYFLIILALIYLYSYSGVTGGHFIYNEF